MNMSHEDRIKADAYHELILEWVDKVTPIINEFRQKFPDGAEGLLQYLLALQFMLDEFCQTHQIPREHFSDFLMTLTGIWFMRGRPKEFIFGCLTEKELEDYKNSKIN